MILLIFWLKTLIMGSQQDGSNKHPQSMFWSKNRKHRCTLVYPSFTIKVGVQGGILFTDMFSRWDSFLIWIFFMEGRNIENKRA